MPEPVEHIDPERLAFYEAWEKCNLKIPNPVKKSEDLWRLFLSAIGGLRLMGLAAVTVLIAV